MITQKELRESMAEGKYDESLGHVYAASGEKLSAYENRILSAAAKFAEIFDPEESKEVAIFTAAGRTEIGGNHTDHQRGKVLTGSVDLDAISCAALNGTNQIRLHSEGYGLTEVNLEQLEPIQAEENTTISLIRGLAAKITEMGYPVKGFDAYVTSDVPGGSGLSSSACFEILVGNIMNHFFAEDKLSQVDLAKFSQYAENVYFGKPSGLMDQMGCGVGGIVTIDFKDKENPVYHAVEVDFAKAGYALCIINSGADHMDLTADYASIPAEMREVAAVFGKEVLSEVPEEKFYDNLAEVRSWAGDRAVLRAIHYYEDCKRVGKQVEALEKEDFDTFIRLVKESGASSFQYLQNVATYRDPKGQAVGYTLAVVEHVLNGKGAFRVHGGGFAGTVMAFVPRDMVDNFCEEVDKALFKGACRITGIRPVGGGVLIG